MDTLDTYKSEKCHLDILHFGVGNITTNDIELASAFQGLLYISGIFLKYQHLSFWNFCFLIWKEKFKNQKKNKQENFEMLNLYEWHVRYGMEFS